MLESDSVAFVRHIARTEATPPLWYALGWVAHQLVGVSPGGFRWTSVLAGGFLAATAVVLAARLLPLWASFFAGLLVAFGWQFVFHGRELRAYELLALEAVLLALAVEAASSRPTTSRLAALGAVVAAGSLTNYFFLLSVSAALIWLWIEPTKRRARRAVTIAIAAGGIPLVIWSPILIHQYRGQQFSWIGPFDVDRVLTAFWLV